MSSTRRSLLVAVARLCLACGVPLAAQAQAQPPTQAPAQQLARERTLLSRAESLVVLDEARDSVLRAQRRVAWRARLSEAGGLALVVPSTVPVEHTLRALDSAQALLRDFGGIPDAFVRTVVLVSYQATDTGAVLAAPALAGRTRLRINLVTPNNSTWSVDGWEVAQSVMTAYAASLDHDWRAWLPSDFGLGRWEPYRAMWAYRELTQSSWSVGARCVAGESAGCRLWLGIDRDSAPYTARYTLPELRSYFSTSDYRWWVLRSERGTACTHGEDAACVDFAIHEQRPGLVPAEAVGRSSLLSSVHALHGPAVVARALADTAGSLGDRLARATGFSEDSLVREWRYWVLTRGGRPRERSFAADAASALLAAGLLLAVATRSRG